MVVSDLTLPYHDVVRQDAADGFVETAADSFFGNLEVIPRPGVAGVHFSQRLFHEMQRATGRVDLEVSSGAIPLDSITPLRHRPFEFLLGKRHGFGQIHFDAVAGRLDVANVHHARESRRPQARDGTSKPVSRAR